MFSFLGNIVLSGIYIFDFFKNLFENLGLFVNNIVIGFTFLSSLNMKNPLFNK